MRPLVRSSPEGCVMSKTFAICSFALLLVSARSAGSSGAVPKPFPAGDHEFSLRHGGRTRTYIVHAPPAPPGPTARPAVLLAFHGGGGNAKGFQEYAELDEIADREGFLVVYPNGTGPLPRRLLTWNAGDGCCGFARQRDVDDVGFVGALLRDLERRVPINRSRVYATGHSNGGIMSHRLAAERSDLVAAIAPVAGSLDLERFAPTNPVAVLQIHSADDQRALYGGGLGPPFPGTDNRVFHQPVQQGLDRWVAANGCTLGPDTVNAKPVVPRTRDTRFTATLVRWRSCRSGVEVAHWKLTGAGHAWPGDAPPPGSEAISGPQTTIIRAAEEVWSFVSRFSR